MSGHLRMLRHHPPTLPRPAGVWLLQNSPKLTRSSPRDVRRWRAPPPISIRTWPVESAPRGGEIDCTLGTHSSLLAPSLAPPRLPFASPPLCHGAYDAIRPPLRGERRSARSQSAPTASPLMRSCNGPCPPARSRGGVDVFSSLRTFSPIPGSRLHPLRAPSKCPPECPASAVSVSIPSARLARCILERTSGVTPRPSVGV